MEIRLIFSSFLALVFTTSASFQNCSAAIARHRGPQPRVVEGECASKGDFRPMVSLAYKFNRTELIKSGVEDAPPDGGFQSFCGGAVVHPKWILTAAHCIEQKEFVQNRKIVRVLVGFIDLKPGKPLEGAEAVFEVEEIVVHREYGRMMKYANDVALLRVKGSFGKREVAVLGTSSESYRGEPATAFGWGRTQHYVQNSYSRYLLKVTEKICNVDWISEMLMQQVQSYDEKFLKRQCICFGWKSKKGVNVGDSGGPLIWGPRKTLIGVASFIDTPRGCGITSYFQRVDIHVDWIRETVCRGDDNEVNEVEEVVEECKKRRKTSRAAGSSVCLGGRFFGIFSLVVVYQSTA